MDRYVAILLVMFLCGCPESNSWTAKDVAMTFASVPAQVCVRVNDERPNLLREAGDRIHAEGLDAVQERQALLELHERDASLRAIVSPAWSDSGGVHIGLCRSSTETLSALVDTVDNWADMGNTGWRIAVAETIRLIDDVLVLLSDFGVVDAFGWLDQYQIAGLGLGCHLRNFMELAARLLEGGPTALSESSDLVQ